MDVSISDLVANAILSTRSDAIIAADREGIIRFWNPGAERMFGHSTGEAIGRSLDLIIPERLRDRHWHAFARVMQTGRSRYGESDLLAVPALRKDGATMSVEFTITVIEQSGKVVGMVAIIRDTTKQYKELRELKRALAQFKSDSA
jgi:PAS domain S-box-containing protein